MISQNKPLILGAVAIIGVFASVQYMMVRENWAIANAQLQLAQKKSDQWEKNFKLGENLLPKPDAVKALNDSNEKLRLQFEDLKKIEFGTSDSLRVFSEAAAGSDDPKNYFRKLFTQTKTKAKDSAIFLPDDLGFTEKNLSDEKVSMNLLRLALVDRFLLACKDAGIPRILRIHYETPRFIPWPWTSEETETEVAISKKKSVTNIEVTDKLIQFPMRVLISAPETSVTQLLYEIQRATDAAHGYFCVRGFHVVTRAQGTGQVEASLALSALLNEKIVTKLTIPVKVIEERRTGPREQDLERY
ncbi:MAG: hypothetical protein V1899_02210 [Planctomycetota bacterium]